ncbi:MAG: hypothetical protein QXI60_00790 [Thermofilaceae archaeon]
MQEQDARNKKRFRRENLASSSDLRRRVEDEVSFGGRCRRNIYGPFALQRRDGQSGAGQSSFVRPKVIPRLKDAEEVLRRVECREDVRLMALVPNERGYERARRSHALSDIALVVAATETLNQKNVGMSVAESLRQFEKDHRAGETRWISHTRLNWGFIRLSLRRTGGAGTGNGNSRGAF